MGEDDRNPFKGKNVVAAMLGHDLPPNPRSGLPTGVDVLKKEEAEKERRAKLRKMKPWERRKYERDLSRVRLTVYIPVPLSELVDEISEQEAVSPSSVAGWLVSVGLSLWKEGRVERPEVVESRDYRTKHALVLPVEWSGVHRERAFELPDVKEDIYRLAAEFECGRSSVVAWLMSLGAKAYKEGMVKPARVLNNSMKYPFRLVLPTKNRTVRRASDSSPKEVLSRYFEKK